MDFWERQAAAWSSPPVDDVGYISSRELLGKSDAELMQLMEEMRFTRYAGWRNHGNRWRTFMGLDDPVRGDILDYGAGTGIETIELAQAGNRMVAADISWINLALVARLADLYGLDVECEYIPCEGELPTIPDGSMDVFHCNGVLHHSRNPAEIMEAAHRVLKPGGIARFMVYSDRGWIKYVGTAPPADTMADPGYASFVRTFDQVGEHADWYSRDKLERLAGSLFDITSCEYITDDDRYLACSMTRR